MISNNNGIDEKSSRFTPISFKTIERKKKTYRYVPNNRSGKQNNTLYNV